MPVSCYAADQPNWSEIYFVDTADLYVVRDHVDGVGLCL
jgi:hypothetical protein